MLGEKEKKIGEMDVQVSLAVGERDAVQLEARTQVEDFEERIKAMQEQLQKVLENLLQCFPTYQHPKERRDVRQGLKFFLRSGRNIFSRKVVKWLFW